MTASVIANARLIVALGRHGSLSAAAAELGVSQQAASARLARLETGLGRVLARRGATGASLTGAGRALSQPAATLMAAAEQWRDGLDRAAAASGAEQPGLRVAASRTVADFLLPGWLTRAGATMPDAPPVTAMSMNSREVVHLVAAGVCELGFVETTRRRTRTLVSDAGLRQRIVTWDELVLVVPPGHAWARRGWVDIDEVARTPLVLREPGSGTREALADAVPGARPARPAMVLESSVAIRSAVIAGAGPAVLSVLVVEGELRRGSLVAVRIRQRRLRRPITALWRGERDRLDPLARALLAVAR